MTTGGGVNQEERLNLKLLGHSDMNGHGATMQVIGHGNYLYVAHFKPPIAVSVVDVSDPRTPRVSSKPSPPFPGPGA